jgi:hypothetical protein
MVVVEEAVVESPQMEALPQLEPLVPREWLSLLLNTLHNQGGR